jgi:hypothetical protein
MMDHALNGKVRVNFGPVDGKQANAAAAVLHQRPQHTGERPRTLTTTALRARLSPAM